MWFPFVKIMFARFRGAGREVEAHGQLRRQELRQSRRQNLHAEDEVQHDRGGCFLLDCLDMLG